MVAVARAEMAARARRSARGSGSGVARGWAWDAGAAATQPVLGAQARWFSSPRGQAVAAYVRLQGRRHQVRPVCCHVGVQGGVADGHRFTVTVVRAWDSAVSAPRSICSLQHSVMPECVGLGLVVGEDTH
jgi:hypothetical protein